MEVVLRLREEEEESSGTETMADNCDSKIVSEPDTSEGQVATSDENTSKVYVVY